MASSPEPDGYDSASQPDSDFESEASQFEFACPRCGRCCDNHAEPCPECGADLGELFSTTYRVPMSPTGRKIALAALIGLALLLLLAVGALVSQFLAHFTPSGG